MNARRAKKARAQEDSGADDKEGGVIDDDYDSVGIMDFEPPSPSVYRQAADILRDKPLWEVAPSELDIIKPCLNWMAFQMSMGSQDSDTIHAPTFLHPVFRALMVRRVKLSRCKAGDRDYEVASDIPPMYFSHTELHAPASERFSC